MRYEKAVKRLRRKAAKAIPCPFCGSIPSFEFRAERVHSAHGSISHYAIRKACCRATGAGQTELFFCNNWRPANYGLWCSMGIRLVSEWNRRAPL